MDVRTDGHSAPAAAAGPQESGRRWLEALEGLDRAAAAGAIAARDGTGRTLAPGHPSEVLLSEEPTPALAARALAAIRIVERAGIDAMPQARQALARGSASADPDVRRAVRRAAHEVAQGACALSRAALAGLLAHRGQTRKDGRTPYAAHPVAVAVHLASAGRGETASAAALVHDVVEDACHGMDWLRRAVQCPATARLVERQSEPPKSRPWRERKLHTLAAVRAGGATLRAVVVADKAHNLRARILERRDGVSERAVARLNAPNDAQGWLAQALMDAVRGERGEPFESFRAACADARRLRLLGAA